MGRIMLSLCNLSKRLLNKFLKLKMKLTHLKKFALRKNNNKVNYHNHLKKLSEAKIKGLKNLLNRSEYSRIYIPKDLTKSHLIKKAKKLQERLNTIIVNKESLKKLNKKKKSKV